MLCITFHPFHNNLPPVPEGVHVDSAAWATKLAQAPGHSSEFTSLCPVCALHQLFLWVIHLRMTRILQISRTPVSTFGWSRAFCCLRYLALFFSCVAKFLGLLMPWLWIPAFKLTCKILPVFHEVFLLRTLGSSLLLVFPNSLFHYFLLTLHLQLLWCLLFLSSALELLFLPTGCSGKLFF